MTRPKLERPRSFEKYPWPIPCCPLPITTFPRRSNKPLSNHIRNTSKAGPVGSLPITSMIWIRAVTWRSSAPYARCGKESQVVAFYPSDHRSLELCPRPSNFAGLQFSLRQTGRFAQTPAGLLALLRGRSDDNRAWPSRLLSRVDHQRSRLARLRGSIQFAIHSQARYPHRQIANGLRASK